MLQSSYWREIAAAMHAYGARLVRKIGADPRALGAMLRRVAAMPGAPTTILLTHPQPRGRATAIGALAGAPADEAANAAGLLRPAEWTGLKTVCGTTTHPPERKP